MGVTEPLTRKNAAAWFEEVRNRLMKEDMWDVIDGSFERPPADKECNEDLARWESKNDYVCSWIVKICAPEPYSHIWDITIAKDAWRILDNIYNPLCLLPLDHPRVAGQRVDFDVADLYEAVCDRKWGIAKEFVDKNSITWNTVLTAAGETALHVAVKLGHEDIVKKLLELVPLEFLEILDDEFGYTPLAVAAAYTGDMTGIAKCMIEKNENIVVILTREMELPVTLAFARGHKELGYYLYSVTPLEYLIPEKGNHGVQLLFWCFNPEYLDVAVNLLQQCPELLFAETEEKWTPIRGIASMPYAFPSGTKLAFWKRWIYKCIIQSTTCSNFVCIDIQQQEQSERVQGLGLRQKIISGTNNFLGIKEMYEMKLLHAQTDQILKLIRRKIKNIDRNMDKKKLVEDALFCAAKEGTAELVSEIINANPSIVLILDESSRHIFFYAVEHRQDEVFKLIHGTRYKNTLTTRIEEKTRNNILHVASQLAPSSQLNLNRNSGAALQMQSELQWFEKVKSVVPPGCRVQYNKDSMKPEDIFRKSHNDLRKDGEKWMKGTATSCSLIGALIVTIMFTAAFTVPGGNNQVSGYPIFLDKGNPLFLLFIISDALSLFSSTTSVLMFLGILTSRYAEKDFLLSLPRKLIIGLFTLFLSIVTMMIAFSACILIMLQSTYTWFSLPIITFAFASVPVTIFGLLHFPLLVKIISSTYCSGIFK